MSLPDAFLTTTCDIYRPFGSGSPTTSNVPCRLIADYSRSRQATLTPMWTHYLIANPGVDLRDAVTRSVGSNSLTYADGDEVRIPTGATSHRFVVVWVERVEVGTPQEYLRAYLLRHVA